MKNAILFLSIALLWVNAHGQNAALPAASPVSIQKRAVAVSLLPIRRVVLYSNGVAYIDHCFVAGFSL